MTAGALALTTSAPPQPQLLALPNPERPDIEAMFREFIRTSVARADAAASTVRLYTREGSRFCTYLGVRGLHLRDVTPRIMRQWVRELVELERTPATIATKIVAVRRLLAAAVDAGMLAANPAQGI